MILLTFLYAVLAWFPTGQNNNCSREQVHNCKKHDLNVDINKQQQQHAN
jgi:hypothetical protein